MDLIEQLNNHSYLNLDALIDKGDLRIELFISEASTECWDRETNDIDDLTDFEKADILERRSCKKYKIVFDEYVSYSVRNESFTVWDDYEKFTGNLFRKFTKSRFLDFVKVSVDQFILEHTQENKISHFGVVCLNNIVDIVSFENFSIEEVKDS